MRTNGKTATTETQKEKETQKIKKLQPRKAQKKTETQKMYFIIGYWSFAGRVVKNPKL